jgi:hypothetical protein
MALRIEQWLGKKVFDLSADPLYTALFHGSELTVLDDRVYRTNDACGMGLTFNQALRVECIHLTPPLPQCAGVPAYPLPFGLRFTFSRQQANAQLVHLAKQEGGGVVHPRLGLIPVWERYLPEGYFLHVEYAPNYGRIQRITLALQVPGGE